MRNLGSLFQRLLTEESKVTKRWRIFAGILAVIVTFTTTYSLILPAITVSNDQVEEVAGLYPDEADFMIMEDGSADEPSADEPDSSEQTVTQNDLAGALIEDDENSAEQQGIVIEETGEETEAESEAEAAEETEEGLESEAVTAAETESETEKAWATDAKIGTSVLSAVGPDYEISITYDDLVGIPKGAVLKAKEIKEKEKEYDDLYAQAVEKLADSEEAAPLDDAAPLEESDPLNENEEPGARFFDIQIVNGEQVIEPSGEVTVSISLKDDQKDADEVEIVHFKDDDDIELIENVRADESGIEFETDSFSVYGVLTTPGSRMDPLNGRIATISLNGYYLTSNTTDVAGNPIQIVKTGDAAQAASWMFESDGNGAYYISTMVGGVKKYMNITPYSGSENSCNLTVGDTPQSLSVQQDGNSCRISASMNGKTYYVNLWGGGSGAGFACWHEADNYTNLTLAFPDEGAGNEYAVVVKNAGAYYVVQNDGSLIPASYDPDTNMVEMEYPLLWEYISAHANQPTWEPFNIRVAAEATGFNPENQLPTGYYYRYIDPTSENGISEENKENPASRAWTCGIRYNNDDHSIVGIQWNNGTNSFDEGGYIGVGEVEGRLHLTGRNSADNAAEVYFAKVRTVPAPGGSTHDDHTVNHIDISVEGTSRITVPLAYGDYYDAEGNVIFTATSEDNKVKMTQKVDITKEDIKRASIKAYIKNEDGTQTEVPNAFYITGYSGNAENNISTPQVRIEGSFKVADLPTIANADNIESVRQARKDNRIYYTVSTVKEVEFTLKRDGRELYDSEHNPIRIKVPVTISSSFDYWDPANECPPLKWPEFIHSGEKAWDEGYICGEGATMTGMDFKLGSTDSEDGTEVPAVEIIKYIQKEDGTLIKAQDVSDVRISVFESTSADAARVGRKGVDEAISEKELAALTDDSYTQIHKKNISIGESGMGVIYDYDIRSGMIYIREDENTVDRFVRDSDGNIYKYVSTHIATEYVKRNSETIDEFYTAEGCTSVPEVVGQYGDLKNMLLEFHVYNVYEPVQTVDVPAAKAWDDFDSDSSYDWTVTARLRYARIFEGESHTSEGFTDFYRYTGENENTYDMVITRSQMADPEASREARTFSDLPKYGIAEDGRFFRFQYSLSEISYEVKQNGTVVYSFDGANYYPAGGDGRYEMFLSHTAGELDDTDNDYYISAANRPLTGLCVRKEWHDVKDPDNYPEIRFTLYQGLIQTVTEYPGGVPTQVTIVQEGQVYVDENGGSYVNIPLNCDNNWTWNCPVFLPDRDSQGRAVGYYVVESTTGLKANIYKNSTFDVDGRVVKYGDQITDRFNDEDIAPWDYYSSASPDADNHSAGHGYTGASGQLPLANRGGIADNEGTLFIVNRAAQYIQFDVKKKWLEYDTDGSLMTTTSYPHRLRETCLKYILMRKTVEVGHSIDDCLVDWENYGVPFYVGWDSGNPAQPFVVDPNNYGLTHQSEWFWQVKDSGQDTGLPAHGYYEKEDGTVVRVKYYYITQELGVYKNTSEEPLMDGYDWYVALLPQAWGPKGEERPIVFGRAVAQDQDRILNVQASDLEVDKEWSETPDNVEEVYVKIYRRRNTSGVIEDFTGDIAARTEELSGYGFVDDPSRLTTLDKGVLVLGLAPGKGSVLIHNVQMAPSDSGNLKTNYYEYWIEEVGYKDKDGNVYFTNGTNSATSTFFAQYNHSDEQGGWEENWTGGAESNRIRLYSKGKNKLRVRNIPTKDIEVEKAWYDENGSRLSAPWTTNPAITSVRFKVKRSDGQYLSFDGSQTLTISAGGQRAVVRTGTKDSAKYSVTYVDDAVDNADIGSWTTLVHGLQKYASDGTEYTYTVEELRDQDGNVLDGSSHVIANCKTSVTGTESTGYVIRNDKIGSNVVKIIKIDETTRENAEQTRLSGAKFKLYRYSVPEGGTAGTYSVYPDEANSEKATGTAEGEDYGTVTFERLPDGCYKISETETPAGYVKTENNDIYFDIVNGAVTRYATAYTGTARTTQEAISETANIADVTYSKEVKAFTVGNKPGAALPNTGGPGTWLFTVFGSFLILLSGALLWRRRRLI